MPKLQSPASLRLLGTNVTLDLGATAGLLTDIKTQVGKLDRVTLGTDRLPAIDTAATVALPNQITDLASQLGKQGEAVLGRVGAPTVSLLADFKQALQHAADDIVTRVTTTPASLPFAVGERAVPLVRLLVQVAALALDKSPGEPRAQPHKRREPTWTEGEENVARQRRTNAGVTAARGAGLITTPPTILGGRVIEAFRPFESVEQSNRSERFVEIHTLIRDLALALPDKPSQAGARP
jgi:hypothetical protein